MLIRLEEDHHLALVRAGYFPYGSAWFYKKIIYWKNESNKSYYHAIVDYYNRSIKLHIDTHKGSSSSHKTEQDTPALRRERSRIRKQTFAGKLNLIQEKYNQVNKPAH